MPAPRPSRPSPQRPDPPARRRNPWLLSISTATARSASRPEDLGSLFAAFDRIRPYAEERPQPDGGTCLAWRDPGSGAGLAVFRKGMACCGTPTFEGSSQVSVIPRRCTDEVDCPYCRHLVVDVGEEDGFFYQMAVHLMDPGLALETVKMDVPATARVVALAMEHWTFPSEDAYRSQRAAPPERRPGRAGFGAIRSLFPLWIVAGGREDVEWSFTDCIVTGVVVRSERRTNNLTGRGFVWTELETYGGTFDLLAADDVREEGYPPRTVFHGRCVMLGKILAQP